MRELRAAQKLGLRELAKRTLIRLYDLVTYRERPEGDDLAAGGGDCQGARV